ncbi:type II toxin-antitoxin system HipA family toxin [Halomonas binhaiensis]|uniref:Type II toxin-antitoxin system HipA family toxin n=1 Tax=Halomonas binhaiensis TaxID=2562282 RepID=A0A5C1NI58_9GAMM|nr:type II toxin-antitoxin system HipA family toxin [Halomonas binhaiensis]QEM81755.1 type II toxin-antitoxin system HipA family toxin [Halomonas binhaiensis]
MKSEPVQVLGLRLLECDVGHLVGYQGGRNILVFADDYVQDPERPVLTLTTHPLFPRAAQLLREPWIRQQRLHPVLSNLLPEGAMREWMAQWLKVHPDNEFPLLAELGHDLPGALVAQPLPAEQIPEAVLAYRTSVSPMRREGHRQRGFSLAGVQMKFSMQEQGGRFHLGGSELLGGWIIKTPSVRHHQVPANEFTVMQLAAAAGVEVPETRLVPMTQIEGLPELNLPDESLAYAIRRFDRDGKRRIHMEDFAQVLFRYAHDKYSGPNYEALGRLLREYSGDGLADLQQFARRLLVNILVANGDAHLKNWSLYYADGRTPRLAPAYDILMTRAYIEDEQDIALNLNGHKNWYRFGMDDFQAWAAGVGVNWRVIRIVLEDTLQRARALWPGLLEDSAMFDGHRQRLRQHWRHLHPDFRIH